MFEKIQEAIANNHVNIFYEFWKKLPDTDKSKHANELTTTAAITSHEYNATFYYILFKIILRDCTNSRFIMTASPKDPTQQSFESLTKSLYGENGIILFNDMLYYIDLPQKTITKINPKPENSLFYNGLKKEIEEISGIAIMAKKKMQNVIISLVEYRDPQENCFEILRANNCVLLKYLLLHASKVPFLEADTALFFIPHIMRIIKTESLILEKQYVEGLLYLLDKTEDHSPEITLAFLNFLEFYISNNLSMKDSAKTIQGKMQKKILSITMQKNFSHRLCLFMLAEFSKIHHEMDLLSIDKRNEFLNSQKLKESFYNTQHHCALIYSTNFDKLEFSDFKKFNEAIFSFFLRLFENTDIFKTLLSEYHSPIYDSANYRVYSDELEFHPKLKTLFIAVKRACAILREMQHLLVSGTSASNALICSTATMEQLKEYDTYQLSHKSSGYHLVTSSLRTHKTHFLHSKNKKEKCEAALFLARYYLEQARKLDAAKPAFFMETQAIQPIVDTSDFEKRNRLIQAGIYMECFFYESGKPEQSTPFDALIAARKTSMERSTPYVAQKNIDVTGSYGQIDWYNAALPLKTYPELLELLQEITIPELIATRNTCIHLTLIEAYLQSTISLSSAEFIYLANLYPEFVIDTTRCSTDINRLCLSSLPKIKYRFILHAMNRAHDSTYWKEFHSQLEKIEINPHHLKDTDVQIEECIFWDQWRNYNAGLNTNGYEDVEQQYQHFFMKYQENPLTCLGFTEINIDSANQTAVNHAYRKRMLTLHPDKRSPQESEDERKQKSEEFLKIQETYNLLTPSLIGYCKLRFSGKKVQHETKKPEKKDPVQLFLQGLKQINDNPAYSKEKAQKEAMLYVKKELQPLMSRKDAQRILVNLLERHTAYNNIKAPESGFFKKFFQNSFKLNSEVIPCSDAWIKIIAFIEKMINNLKADLPSENVKTGSTKNSFFTTNTPLSNQQKEEVFPSDGINLN